MRRKEMKIQHSGFAEPQRLHDRPEGLPSGCYPLDSYYKSSALAQQLKIRRPGDEDRIHRSTATTRPQRQGIAAALLHLKRMDDCRRSIPESSARTQTAN